VLAIAQDVIAATGSRSDVVFIDRPVDDPGVRRPDTGRAERLLGWQPRVPWSEGLARTVDSFRSLGALTA
jgi:dTDP-glucose 4,6-dehydratase